MITADRVILAAGCVGTAEILLRSKAKGHLPNLSEQLGSNFSTNGDYLAFLDRTRERVSLTRGPITTSFAHFGTPTSAIGDRPPVDSSKFHTIEDNGIPRALSSLTGVGMRMLRSLSSGHRTFPPLGLIAMQLIKRLWQWVIAILSDARKRHELFQSEDEWTARMMCIAAMGREGSSGQFSLGGRLGETPLRVGRKHGKFRDDPIYSEIRATLDSFAMQLSKEAKPKFLSPFFDFKKAPIALSHPLGGCSMARTAEQGTADEFGRVFDRTKTGPRPFYEGLYIADASIIPTSLGVNPSLTISALSLRIVDNLVKNELSG